MIGEAEVVAKARSGDQRAFEQLVLSYEGKVYNVALRSAGNEQDAMDITQEVFIRVYRSLPSLREDVTFSTWLYRITCNICIDFSRRRRGKNTISLYMQDENGSETPVDIADSSPTPEERVLGRELGDEISRALCKLSSSHRRIILLRDVSGLSYSEISEALSISEGTVKSRLARAREHLRSILVSNGTVLPEKRLFSVEGGGKKHE